MKKIRLKPYQKLLVLFEQKAKLRTATPFENVELSVEEIESSLGNEIHLYRLSTYIWLIKTNVGGVVNTKSFPFPSVSLSTNESPDTTILPLFSTVIV